MVVPRKAKPSYKKLNEQAANGTSVAKQPLGSIENPCIIVKYRNGLLVRGVFYDYASPRNAELGGMLANKEFDGAILGLNTADAYVLIEEHGENYCANSSDGVDARNSTKRIKHRERLKSCGTKFSNGSSDIDDHKKSNIPPDWCIPYSDDRFVTFKLCYENKVSIAKVAESLAILDVTNYLFRVTGMRLSLIKNDTVLAGSESITSIDKTLVYAVRIT